MGFADADALMWIDGELHQAGGASVPALDHGITVGDGVFEALKVVRGRPFALRRHLDRLDRSIAAVGLPPLDRLVAEQAVREVIAANAALLNGDYDICRITYTDGVGPLGSGRSDRPRPRLIAAVTHHDAPPATASAITVPWRRNEHGALTGVKSTSYAENAMGLARARAAGAHEAFFANTAGNLCEGTRSNIFIAKDGRLTTPPLSDGCLAGVTRALVLEWTDAVEATLPMAALREADEVFITSTGNDVTPIVAIDGAPVAYGEPGPLTVAAQQAFRAGQARDLEP